MAGTLTRWDPFAEQAAAPDSSATRTIGRRPGCCLAPERATRSGPSCGRLQPRAAALDGSMASRETAAPS
jgi:hypothetical protein